MRDIEVTRDREWIVVTTTSRRRSGPPRVKRTYWTPDEFARIVELVRREITPSTSAGAGGGPP